MKAIKAIYGALSIAVLLLNLATGIPTFMERYGVDVGPFFGWFAANSGWLLPLSCLALGLLVGFGVGWSIRSKSDNPRRMTRKEKREIRERTQEQAERIRDSVAASVMQLNPNDRALFVVLADGKSAYGKGEDWRRSIFPSEEFFTQFFKVAYMDGDIAKITPAPLLGQLFSEYPDLKEGVSETIDRHKAKSAQAGMYSLISYGGTILPYWWWTE